MALTAAQSHRPDIGVPLGHATGVSLLKSFIVAAPARHPAVEENLGAD